jgi:hypothetical protein
MEAVQNSNSREFEPIQILINHHHSVEAGKKRVKLHIKVEQNDWKL